MRRNWRETCYSVDAIRAEAKRQLPLPIFDFVDGGAELEWTLAENEAGFRRISFLPRPLNGTVKRDLSVTLFGKRLAMPVLIGPTGLSGLMWPKGELAASRARVLSPGQWLERLEKGLDAVTTTARRRPTSGCGPCPVASEPPTITGSNGSTHGANVVRTPASTAPSRAITPRRPWP